jgi:N-acetylmuramoyl-L-alanine amidase
MSKQFNFLNFSNQPGVFSVVVLLIGFAFSVVGQNNKSLGFKTVVIDAGHGGKDPGAIGKIIKEKDVVLPIALKVGEYIAQEMPGVKVVYTRSTDIFVPLDERAEIANRARADLYVSIHANSISNPKIVGAETFVLGLHRSQDNLEVAKKENSVIVLEDDYNTKYEGFDPNSTESYIIFELMQNVYLDQSIEVASLVQDQFEKRVGRHNRGVKQAGFLVLRQTAMPGILVEVGFLSNRNEEKFLATAEGQDFLASAIFRAVRDYKTRFEARNSISNTMVHKDKLIITPNAELPEGSQVNDNSIQANNKGELVEYRIQIASSGQRIKDNSGPYTQFNDVWVYQEGSLFKYTTGLTNSYSEIVELLNVVRNKVPDSFIVAFKNGKKVPLSSVR